METTTSDQDQREEII